MAIKEFKIGETFQLNGITLRCERGYNKCKGCFFREDQSCMNKDINEGLGLCSEFFRNDNTGVIFVKVDE